MDEPEGSEDEPVGEGSDDGAVVGPEGPTVDGSSDRGTPAPAVESASVPAPDAPWLRGIPSLWGLPPVYILALGVVAVCLAFLASLQVAAVALDVVNRGLGELLPVLLLSGVGAYLLDPLIDRFERAGWDRSRAILVCLALFLSVAAVALLGLVPYVVSEVSELSSNIDRYVARVGEQGAELQRWLSDKLGRPVDLGMGALSERLPELARQLPSVADPLKKIGQTVLGSSFGLLGAVFRWSLFPVFTFFFLRDFDTIKRKLYELVPFRWRGSVLEQYIAIDEKMASFVRGQLMVCAVLAVLYAGGLVLFTDIHLAALIGVVAGALFLIPYFGTFLGVVSGSLMAVLEFGFSFEIVKVWIVFAVVQGIEGSLLTPKIVGDSVGLHPVVVMLALFFGGGLFGFLGIMLAVPVAAALQVLIGAAIQRARGTQWFQVGREDAPGVDQVP